MSKFKPTLSQQQALTAEGNDILVSASAGAGKTTILVDRILRKLLAGQEIDQLLVVTFTEAAAREMKQRLQQRIQEQSLASEDNNLKQHLNKQLAKIPTAYISTLHAFCLRVIRKFYYLIDLDPMFRLLSDDNERYLLQERAWDKVKQHYYKAKDEQFLVLENNFTNSKVTADTPLAELVYRLADFALTNPQPEVWLSQLPDMYKVTTEVSQAKFYQDSFLPMLEQQLRYVKLQLNEMQQQIATFEELVNYQTSVDQLEQQIQDLLVQYKHCSWDELRALFKQLTKISGRVKPKTAAEIVQPLKDCKENISKVIQDWQYKFFVLDNKQWVAILQDSAALVTKLVAVEQRFLHVFRQEKQHQHCLDFNDLEQYTLQIFRTKKDNQFLARSYYQQQFTEILVDEYQDTNPLQEAIIQQFKSTQPGNLFMVGDVKQSIYGFRQAAPFLFTNKYQAMQKDPNAGQLINLSDNFRSSTNVIQTVNEIFTRVMDQRIGDIDYTGATKLIASVAFSEQLDTQTEILFYQNDDSAKSQISNEQAQIRLIILRIQQLIASDYQVYDAHFKQMRTLKYSDIAILTRVKNLNNDLVEQFNKAQIPIIVHDTANYFQTTEIQIMLSMLKIIDNPRQDIPLVAVLRSSMVGLDENELAYLRINHRTGDYYDALTSYLANSEYNQKNEFAQRLTHKVTDFVAQLQEFRSAATKISIAELIWQIFLKTGFLSYVQGMPNGKQRVANLHALYQRAEQFEQMEFKGLFQFIRFIDHIQENNKDLAQPIVYNPQSNEVNVMTIHGSKGLEFPLVFLLNIDHNFNNEDLKKPYLLDTRSGIGIKYLDDYRRISYETLPLAALKATKKNQVLSEELRLLYVALTRAQQKLILVGSLKQPLPESFDQWQLATAQQEKTVLDIGLRAHFRSFQDVMQPIISLNGRLQETKIIATKNSPFDFLVQSFKGEEIQLTPPNIVESFANSSIDSPLFVKTAKQILNLDYPYQEATKTTAYQSVSEIKHLFSDPDDRNLPQLHSDNEKGQRYILPNFKRPKFLTQDKKQVSATDIGSATHLLLQKITLKHCPTVTDFQQLAQELVKSDILSPVVAEQINYADLATFFTTNLGQNILQHQDTLQREWTFSMLLPAQKIFQASNYHTQDRILVHGIIDGLFIDQQQHITIFDYKTDYIDLKKEQGKHSLAQAVHNYSGQLKLYQQAAEQILQHPVQQQFLCMLSVNEVVKVN
ncbi:helicase-exonuclease AddAB subunit AddA [Bombilactobacillus thymidiniphilus]|uniref:ATP-dependent helicase/nuclease subunit A n=1 Tax=Bombilactobacillus thymidiniphilus TaxID=2923363 RepID=A0ABY4PCY9_9LACO|nr:helicase-exonuclease AddAB subunit AddA [Bombilactobacillus thymidiniphilus]UQS83561.1 helicase-exonuclease AddAB subunit AddA [Bombilactobacillus thymidiniphilus]